MDKPYKPTTADLNWAKMTVGMLKDGGHWGCSWGLYRIDKTSKVVTLTEKTPWFPEEAFKENHLKTKVVFKAIGYDVTEETKEW